MYVTISNIWIVIKKKYIHSLCKPTHTDNPSKTGLGQPALPSVQKV